MCIERRKCNLSGILAKFDGNISPHGQRTTAIQQQDLHFQWLLINLLRSHHLKSFIISLNSSISNYSLAQQLSLHHYISWLLDNGWGNNFIDQAATIHGLYVGRSLPRICHNLLNSSSNGNIPNFPLLRNCSSGDASSQLQFLWESSMMFGTTLSNRVAKKVLYLGHIVWLISLIWDMD